MIKVAIIFGGRSAEHEVSLLSAKSVSSAIDREKFSLVYVFIAKDGKWYLQDNVPEEGLADLSTPLSVVPGGGSNFLLSSSQKIEVDVVLPILHGTFGEDGTIQGLFEMCGVPFAASTVLGSAVSMDKEVSKKILQRDGIPIARFLSFKEKIDVLKVEEEFSYPVFVKPANLGSSVGVSKARNKEELLKAAQEAFLYDSKIIVEEFIKGREIECSVLGNESPVSSVPGEVVVGSDFYSYETKYLNKGESSLVIPADIPKETEKEIREMAVSAFRSLCCEGMARADFFVSDERVILNELNSIPGFTEISMYPKLWQATGLSYKDLITKIIELGIESHTKRNTLKTFYKK